MKNGLLQLRNSPLFYPTLVHLVPWHFGHGGNTSELSSNLITSPHFTHLYKPFPGFSPVLYINLLFKKLIKTLILLTAFFHRTNFNFFSYSCLRSFSSFFRRDKLSASCISNTSRSFTHKLEFLKLILCFHLKGLKAYPQKNFIRKKFVNYITKFGQNVVFPIYYLDFFPNLVFFLLIRHNH